MNCIGFRVTPNEIYYSILENRSDQYEFVSISNLKIPVSTDLPNQLSFIRNALSTIITQYKISYAGLKLIEGNARGSVNNGLIFRFNVEGVIMELLSNSDIHKYFLGVSSNISSVLNVKKSSPQDMLSQLLDVENYKTGDNKKIKNEHKDSMIVALAAMELGVQYE